MKINKETIYSHLITQKSETTWIAKEAPKVKKKLQESSKELGEALFELVNFKGFNPKISSSNTVKELEIILPGPRKPGVASFSQDFRVETIDIRSLLAKQQQEFTEIAAKNRLHNPPPSLEKLLEIPEVKIRTTPPPKLHSLWQNLMDEAKRYGSFLVVFILKYKKIIFLVTALGIICLYILHKRRGSDTYEDLSKEEALVQKLTLELIKEIRQLNDDLEKIFKAAEILEKKKRPEAATFAKADPLELDIESKIAEERAEETIKREYPELEFTPLQDVADFVEQAKSKVESKVILESVGLDTSTVDLISAQERIQKLQKEVVLAKRAERAAKKEAREVVMEGIRKEHADKVSRIKELNMRELLNEQRRLANNVIKAEKISWERLIAISLLLTNPNAMHAIFLALRLGFRNVLHIFGRRFPGDHR